MNKAITTTTHNRISHKLFLFIIAIFFTTSGFAQPFITTWKTDNPGTSNSTSITIQTTGGGYNYDVDWNNDGVFDEFGITGNVTHDYGVAGVYTIRIQGDFPRIYFNNTGDKEKILVIEQWGSIEWSSMSRAFWGASNLTYNAGDAPDLSNVIDMASMFGGATSFNGDISGWDVSSVTIMAGMFRSASSFNGDISLWDVSNVISMTSMFKEANFFNGDVSAWDVSSVTDMYSMFWGASSFNGDLSIWDVSSVTSMYGMFYSAIAFNGDISLWDVSSVTSMYGMFYSAIAFNGDISAWDVSSVTDMSSMFNRSSSFNGDVSAWDVSNVTNTSSMFRLATSFNGDISTWDVSSVTNTGSMFHGAHSFNGDLSIWDVSSVTSMYGMFYSAISFNGDMSLWDVSSVTSMNRMFNGSSSFNGDISAWDVSSVTDMSSMFGFAASFNGDISAWDVSSVMDVWAMFSNASSFNQSLGSWNISSTTSMTSMLSNSGLSTINYDNTLIKWDEAGYINKSIGVFNLNYCNGEDARLNMLTNKGWTFSGDNLDCTGVPSPFITSWKTDNPGASNATSITIPTNGGGYNYDVDWDGNGIMDEFGVSGDVTHDYGVSGTYTIRIQGDFPAIYFNNVGDKEKIKTIEQWGDIAWGSMDRAFYGASNLTYNATDSPNLTSVTQMPFMFHSANVFNGDINAWDVSNVTNMSGMFLSAGTFNQDLNLWNVGNVTDMSQMFRSANAFNGDITTWNVGSVTDMSSMFYLAGLFNKDIGGWNVGSVTNMSSMFLSASIFNQNLNTWNVGSVTNMSAMFRYASLFNGNVSTWDVGSVTDMSTMFSSAVAFNGNINNWTVSAVEDMSFMFYLADVFNGDVSNWIVNNVTDMSSMFRSAIAFNGNVSGWNVSSVADMSEMFNSAGVFNRNLGSWDIGSVTDMTNILNSAGLSTTNYDNTLMGWESQVGTPSGLSIDATNLTYCNGETARNSLINTYGWSIFGDTKDCSALPVELINFTARLFNNKTVKLNWQTASEINNKGYEVEKSLDTKTWQNIGFVAGNDTSTERNSYAFTENNPYKGLNYYRLKQIDFDGDYAYSKIINVEIVKENQIQIYPNPTAGIFNIRSPHSKKVKIEVLTAMGQIVKTIQWEEGVSLDITELPAGLYLMNFYTDKGVINHSLVKE